MSFRPFPQGSQLLPEREILSGQLGLTAKKGPKENEDQLNAVHLPLPNSLP